MGVALKRWDLDLYTQVQEHPPSFIFTKSPSEGTGNKVSLVEMEFVCTWEVSVVETQGRVGRVNPNRGFAGALLSWRLVLSVSWKLEPT